VAKPSLEIKNFARHMLSEIDPIKPALREYEATNCLATHENLRNINPENNSYTPKRLEQRT